MLDISTISFKVDTSELDRAGKAIGELVTNVGKLDKAARDAAQTEATLARAAKDSAKANLDNAKAQDVRLKSTITADKADQQAAAAIERKTKATERASTAIKKNADMLQLQNDTYDFILEGFSKGDAKVLAMAKATGQLSDQLKQVLTDIRQFSKNTFDQTETGLDRMVKSAKEASSAQGFLNNGLNLTSKQAKELSNDLDRLNIRLQHQGKSYQEITKEQAIYKQRFVEEANAVNRATSALAAVEKQRKDVVSATNYLTQAEAKMAAALNTSNAALDKAGTDSLVKYESALRKSGVSQDVATLKLAKYKAQLEQVQIQEQKRREEHLTRALAPQATDIVVSLWSGQNPLTVLLQQGGQVTDLFMQSGIAAEKFGEVVKSSMKSMLPSILTVVGGVGGLLVDGLTAAGNAVLGFVGKVTGMSGAIDGANKKLMDMGWTTAAAGVRGLGILMTTVFAAGAGAVVAGLVAIGVALKQTISENDKMAVSLGLTGAAMGLTFSTATDLSKSMQGIGVSTSDAMQVLSEMAKQGKLTSNDVRLVTKAAVDMKTYAGVAIEDTVKQFVKMKEKPVEAMIELARATGLVAPEVVKAILELEDQGKTAEATSRAIEELARVNDEQVERMKESYNGFSLFMIDLGKGISKFFSDAFKDLFYAASPTEQLKTQLKAVDETLNNWGTMNMDAVGAIQMLIPGEKERLQLQRTQLLNQIALLDQEKQQYEVSQKEKQDKIAMLGLEKSISDELAKRDLKRSKKKDNLQDFTANFIEEKAKDAAKSKNLDLETIKNNDALMESYKKLAQVEWESAQKKPKKDPQVNYLATLMREATNATITADGAVQELTKSQIKLQEVQADPRYQSLAEEDKKRVAAIYEKAAATEKATAAQDLANKLLGKADMLGSTYYETIKKIDAYQQQGTYSAEYAERLRKAAFDQTELAKTRLKIEEDSYKLVEKYRDENEKALNSTVLENAKLDDRLALLGLTSEQQKYLRIEQERRNKLLAIDLKLQTQIQDVWDKWGSGGFGQGGATKAKAVIIDLEQAAAEERKTINREVAVQAAEDYDAEFKKIKSTVSESIAAALFDGGKAGSSKIKDYLKSELRERITLYIDAFINPIMGTVAGALGFGGGSSAGGAGSVLSTAGGIGNLLGGLGSFGSTIAGGIGSAVGSIFGVGAGNVALGTSLGLGASSSTAAALAAAQAGGAVGGAGASSMGSFLSGAGSAMPYIGAAVGLLSIISGMDDSGTYHTGGAAQYSAFGGLRNSLGFRDNEEGLPSYNPKDNIDNQFGTGFGYVERSDQTISAMETLSKSLVQIFDGIAKTFGKTAGYEVATAFADDTSEDGAWGAFKVQLGGVEILNWDDFRQSRWAPKEFGDGEEGYKQYLSAISKDTRKVLMDMDLPSWANKILSDLGESASIESLTSAITQIGNIKTVFENLKSTFVQLSSATDSTLESLMNLSGGIDYLATSASSYYTNFYSDTEKATKLQNDLTKSLAIYNLTLPETKDAYRALVEAQDVATESGAKAYVALLQNSAMFSELIAMQAALSETMKSLKEETSSLEIELLRLQGKTTEADARQRAIDTAGMSEAEIAVYDYNAALRAQVKALEDAAESVKELSSSVIDEINRLRGYTDTSGNSPQALIAEFDRLTTLARGGDANAFNSLGDTSKLLDDYYKNTATSAVQYAYQRSVLANSLEQSYNTAKASGGTFSGTSSLMGTPALSAPVVSSVSSANTAGSSGIADLLSAVVTELTMLRAEVRADVAHNAKTAKILERVTPEGDALATRNEG